MSPVRARVHHAERDGHSEARAEAKVWIEAALAHVSAILFVLTLFIPDWIEAFFGLGLDQGSGSLERAIVAVLFVTTVVSTALARREWRRRMGLSTTR
jgi:hypothetical protein